jgi:hypothetical protein
METLKQGWQADNRRTKSAVSKYMVVSKEESGYF